MVNVRILAIVTLGVGLGSQSMLGQDLSLYRAYALESSLDSVVKASGARETDVKTLHDRPARIQELEWRAPYGSTGSELADPVRAVVFEFYNDQLYRLVVTYDRARTEGLTNDDVIASISAIYGVPVLPRARTTHGPAATSASADTTVVARWENDASSLTLVRGVDSPELQLVLVSKSLSTRASSAIKEAITLNAREAPQREMDQLQNEMDQLKKAIVHALAVQDKARIANKAAFRP